MEKIIFSESVHVYKGKMNFSDFKDEILEICTNTINKHPKVKTDGFGYNEVINDLDFSGNIEIKNKLDEVIQMGINKCIEIYQKNNIDYNIIETDGWVNVVRAQNPVQGNFNGGEKYHKHTDLNVINKTFVPTYTYVYYIQMPNNLSGDDGVLYFKDKNDIEYNILPEEDDIIIMGGDVPHTPNNAENSTVDRIVFAGNVGFKNVKKQKSLI